MTQLQQSPPAAVHPAERVGKFARRREELAMATLQTLGELGFARTSLREIAQKTSSSHGVLHYYFHDKNELITFCVRLYKQGWIHRYDQVIADATSAEGLARDFATTLLATLRDETAMHLLWYDLRTQAFFDTELRETVVDIDAQLEDTVWRVLARYSELGGGRVVVTRAQAYAMFDGSFEHALTRQTLGGLPDDGDLVDQIVALFTMLAPQEA